jgi:hypothetical protein
LKRPPIGVYFITIAGIALAVMMTWEGLFLRIFGEFKQPAALWLQGVSELGINPHGFAWPWIVLGISWIGALAGLWLRLAWGKGAVLLFAILSLFYVGIGTLFAASALLCILLPSSRRWMTAGNV